jgi:hypothetical protein
MGPRSYMQFVVARNVVMRRMTVCTFGFDICTVEWICFDGTEESRQHKSK